MIHEHSTEESTSSLLPSSIMRRRRRSRWNGGYGILLTPRSAICISCWCMVSCFCFVIVLYLNISAVRLLFDNSEPIGPIQAAKPSLIHIAPLVPVGKSSSHDDDVTYKEFNYLRPKSLTYTRQIYSKEIPILYRFPKQREIRALLLIFHGCGRSAFDWFHTVERQRIIGAAIDLGFACLAFQATDQTRRCWSSEMDLSGNPDIQMVNRATEGFFKEHPKLESLPRYTFGASSGGVFSSIFVISSRYPIQGQILFISIIHPEVLDGFIRKKNYPATAWIYMVRDQEFASEARINASMKTFAEAQIPHIAFKIEPISLTPSTFHQRIPTITDGTSRYLYYRLQQNKWLDSQNYLTYNPRRVSTWQTFLYQESNDTETKDYLNNLEKHKDILPDFLNTIYGEHEISFERSLEAFKWLQASSSANSDRSS